jgi:hypothetical protein
VRDMTSGETQTLKLPAPMRRTFTARYKHFIVVVGQGSATLNNSWAIETTFGVFDTHTNKFTIIPSSFNSISQDSIFGLTVVDDKVYVLYGTYEKSTFSIYRASL